MKRLVPRILTGGASERACSFRRLAKAYPMYLRFSPLVLLRESPKSCTTHTKDIFCFRTPSLPFASPSLHVARARSREIGPWFVPARRPALGSVKKAPWPLVPEESAHACRSALCLWMRDMPFHLGRYSSRAVGLKTCSGLPSRRDLETCSDLQAAGLDWTV